VECESEGVGVDPRNPPLAWEAWTAGGWAACEPQSDGTGGLNRSGDVVLHVPAGHAGSVLGGRRAGWVRCRVLAAEAGQHPYRRSPVVHQLFCFTVGGTAESVHAETIRDELLGGSDGSPGQRLPLLRRPVVPGDEPPVLQVSVGDGWQDWTAVESFAGRLPGDEVFLLDHSAGEVQLAPAVRERDGSLRRYGRVPPKGARLRLREYRVGGGRRGNVAAGALRVLKSSVPYVARAENRRPAAGGVDGEEVANAVARGPLLLRTRDRAVTAEDFEDLAKQAAPQVERVRCVPATGPDEAGGARVLVVPAVGGDALGGLRFEQLIPDDDTLRRIAAYLDERRVIGTRVVVEPPYYQGVTVVARLTARPRADAEAVRRDALAALYRYLHPVLGGPAGTGWPFGRPVQAGDIFAVLQRVTGCELVEDVKLYPADPVEGQRGEATQRVDVPPHGLAHSYEHQIRVQG
jgi:predicted phage baseplate assembly protein